MYEEKTDVPSAMPIPMTEYGRKALTRLLNLHNLAVLIPADNRSFNNKLQMAQAERRVKTLAQLRPILELHLAPGQNMEDLIRFPRENELEGNVAYTSALEKFVAESVLCACVDTYHWYLRRVFEAALIADRSHIDAWAKTLDLKPKKVEEIRSAGDLRAAIASIFRRSEEQFRVLAHVFLNVPDLATIPKAVVVRNCLVHELGEDRSGKVSAALAQENDLGVVLAGETVVLPVDAAYELVGKFLSDISIMDQALANVLSLPTDPSSLPAFSRAYT